MKNKTPNEPSSDKPIPEAEVHTDRGSLVGALRHPPCMFLLVPILCLVIAIGLFWSGYSRNTTTITVRFEEGHGIKPGDRLQHRGIDIGEIISVTLNQPLSHVNVEIELESASRALAREGSRFWIERPRISLARVSGLETVVGAKYVGVMPGPLTGRAATAFIGDETPPTLRNTETLDISIRFANGYGLVSGDVVKYRGIIVGEVVAMDLNEPLDSIEVLVRLAPSGQRLARAGTRFWIERPRFQLTGVSGLDTVVGAKYVGVVPGPLTGPAATEFIGEETPPTLRNTETLDIHIRFANGYGLVNGDVVKYRGIVVGEVVAMDLNEPLDGIDVHVRLATSGQRLARAGTRFWIERPRFQLTGVSGLDTLTSGQHIGAIAGPANAPVQYVFDGLEEPPAMVERQPDGLEIVLNSRDRQGIDRGAPVTYRGLRVGHVVSVGLSSDAAQIETRMYVEPSYRQLIRQNSVFWSIGGLDVNFGFRRGLQINSETLATIAAGGIGMGTPDPAGPQAIVGSRFELREEPDDWQDWTPRIPIGTSLLPDGLMLPQPVRVALVWKQRFLGISKSTHANGWGLLLADNRLIGPVDLLTPPAAAVGGVAALQFEGTHITATAEQADIVAGLALLQLQDPLPGGWPLDRIRHMTKPEDCLIVFGSIDDTRSLPATRLSAKDGQLLIDPTFTLPQDAHGASVVAIRDGKLVAIIAIEAGRPHLLSFEPVLAR